MRNSWGQNGLGGEGFAWALLSGIEGSRLRRNMDLRDGRLLELGTASTVLS